MIDIPTTICNKIWKTGEWPTTWTQTLVITLPKKGNLQLCQNYRTISLISHPSKVMLKIILNRLKPQAEEIIAEEQAGFRAGRSTTEQIFNLRILGEKYLQHQQNLYHVFMDFKKAFDRVWHEALWATMKLLFCKIILMPSKINDFENLLWIRDGNLSSQNFIASSPNSCEIFVYKLTASNVVRSEFSGILLGRWVKKSISSLV